MSLLTFGLVGAGAQAVSTLFSAFGNKSVTKYNNAIAQAQADIARINAESMEFAYGQRLFAAESEYQRETMRAGQAKAQQRAALAANGVAIGVGSAAELQASTDIIKQTNLIRLETNAKAEAWGYKAKATDYRNQALMAEAKKQSASSVFANTLLGGAANIGFGLASSALYDKVGTTAKEQKPTNDLKVDAISSAQPTTLVGSGVKPSVMYKTKNKYSPFYGV